MPRPLLFQGQHTRQEHRQPETQVGIAEARAPAQNLRFSKVPVTPVRVALRSLLPNGHLRGPPQARWESLLKLQIPSLFQSRSPGGGLGIHQLSAPLKNGAAIPRPGNVLL